MAVHHVSLRRPDPSYSWGFRLQGGADYQTPLSIESVAPGTVAEHCGLMRGDLVVGINGQTTDYLQHEAAKMSIVMSGNHVVLTVRRDGGGFDDYGGGGGGGGRVSVWRPSVQPVHHQQQQQQQLHHSPMARSSGPGRFPAGSGSMFSDLPKVTNTSLAANKSEHVLRYYDNNYNSSPRPFTHGYAYGPAAKLNQSHRNSSGGTYPQHASYDPAASYRQVRPPESEMSRSAGSGRRPGLL